MQQNMPLNRLGLLLNSLEFFRLNSRRHFHHHGVYVPSLRSIDYIAAVARSISNNVLLPPVPREIRIQILADTYALVEALEEAARTHRRAGNINIVDLYNGSIQLALQIYHHAYAWMEANP